MKKLVLCIGLVLSTVFYSTSQQIDSNASEYKILVHQFNQIISEKGLFYEPSEYKDHTHLRNNLMKIILSDDNSELFESVNEVNDVFGSITYFKMINGVVVYTNCIVPFADPNESVYTTTTLPEIIDAIKSNYPKKKSLNPDQIKASVYFDNHDTLLWKFNKDKIEFELEVLFNHTQIKQITLLSFGYE